MAEASWTWNVYNHYFLEEQLKDGGLLGTAALFTRIHWRKFYAFFESLVEVISCLFILSTTVISKERTQVNFIIQYPRFEK